MCPPSWRAGASSAASLPQGLISPSVVGAACSPPPPRERPEGPLQPVGEDAAKPAVSRGCRLKSACAGMKRETRISHPLSWPNRTPVPLDGGAPAIETLPAGSDHAECGEEMLNCRKPIPAPAPSRMTSVAAVFTKCHEWAPLAAPGMLGPAISAPRRISLARTAKEVRLTTPCAVSIPPRALLEPRL